MQRLLLEATITGTNQVLVFDNLVQWKCVTGTLVLDSLGDLVWYSGGFIGAGAWCGLRPWSKPSTQNAAFLHVEVMASNNCVQENMKWAFIKQEFTQSCRD